MQKIAVMGFGTVGSGVYEALEINAESIASRLGDKLEIAHILDLRSFPEHKAAALVTSDAEKIFADPEVSVVVETMGGSHPAVDFSRRALAAGKSVVTSNKECVEKFGEELEALAAANSVSYLYEASAGGGIPCIHTIKNCLAWGKLTRIAGILNGTTNFILTEMKDKGLSYADALSQAQKNGFAEANPTADVDGFDAARKICILAGIAWDRYIHFEELPLIEGIRGVTIDDLKSADDMGYSIKLIASATDKPAGLEIFVAPMLVNKSHLLSSVGASFNAVSVTGISADEVVLYGRGAGSLPTANAIVSDVIEALTVKPIPRKRHGEAKPFIAPNTDGITLPSGRTYRML